MRNYIQPGNTITLTAPYAVTSGDGLLVGSIFGVAAADAANAETVEAALNGMAPADCPSGSGAAARQLDPKPELSKGR